MKASGVPTHTLLAVQGYKIQQTKEGKTNLLEPKYQSISKERNKEKTNKIGGPYHIGCRKTQGKTPWNGEKQGHGEV
jgi:hypothetical protein